MGKFLWYNFSIIEDKDIIIMKKLKVHVSYSIRLNQNMNIEFGSKVTKSHFFSY